MIDSQVVEPLDALHALWRQKIKFDFMWSTLSTQRVDMKALKSPILSLILAWKQN